MNHEQKKIDRPACSCGCTCYYCHGGHEAGAEFCVFGHASYCDRRKQR